MLVKEVTYSRKLGYLNSLILNGVSLKTRSWVKIVVEPSLVVILFMYPSNSPKLNIKGVTYFKRLDFGRYLVTGLTRVT